MRVFKYTGHAVSILETGRVRVSRADDLNDPFELTPWIDPKQFNSKRVLEYLRGRSQVDKAHVAAMVQRGPIKRNEFERTYFSTLPKRVNQDNPGFARRVQDAQKGFATRFSKLWRLFCVSRRRDSILMWSHYAHSHTGAVIEFETSIEPVFGELEQAGLILPVNYSKDKASYTAAPEDAKRSMQEMKKVACTKAKEWEYEKEVRLFIPLEHCIADGEFFVIPPAAIRRVILGARMLVEANCGILKQLARPWYGHVAISQAHLSSERYELEFEDIREGEDSIQTPPQGANPRRHNSPS